MSTLTKVLIVLICLFSIFLCGIVVTYVGSATNYKAAYEQQKSTQQALKAKSEKLTEQLDAKIAAIQNLEDGMSEKLQALKKERSRIETELRNSRRDSLAYQERVNSWAGVVKGLNQTISDIEQSLKLARSELDQMRNNQIKDRKNLNQITSVLNEKMAQIDSLEGERRRLLEQKVALENKLNEFGIAATGIEPVTQTKAVAIHAPAIVPSEGVILRGFISAVDLQNSLVTISLGSADGVRKGLKFYTARGGEFICEITITDVDVDNAAGIMELVQQTPRVGDSVTTSL